LDAKANVNAANKDGDTPLSLASQERHDDVVQLLKAAGATK
jgi:ankyrin repeat protein